MISESLSDVFPLRQLTFACLTGTCSAPVRMDRLRLFPLLPMNVTNRNWSYIRVIYTFGVRYDACKQGVHTMRENKVKEICSDCRKYVQKYVRTDESEGFSEYLRMQRYTI